MVMEEFMSIRVILCERLNEYQVDDTNRYSSVIIYKYDIPVGCTPGITSPREDSIFRSVLGDFIRGCHIHFIIPNNMQNT